VAHDRIAAAYAQLGSLDRAIAHLSEAARLDPRPERLASLESARRDAASRRNDAGP
jgi:Flp pilus assembly protein TadD